jgi:uncharacterized RmlC-like cupin family protein
MSTRTSPSTCRLVRAGQNFIGKQGLTYTPAISAESVGASALHMQLVAIPPGGKAKPTSTPDMKPRSTHSAVFPACGTAKI